MATVVETPAVVTVDEKDKKKSLVSYIIIAVIAVALIVIVWYAYSRFTKNQQSFDGKKPDKAVNKDETLSDYNLQDAIDQIEKKQREILKNLSEDTGI